MNFERFKQVSYWITLSFAIALAVSLSIGRALSQPFSHDEHQFVASARLLTHGGYIPYVDYPYHHAPNLIGIYALANFASPFLLLNARLVSAAAASLSAILIFLIIRNFFTRDQWLLRTAIPLLGMVLFLINPITAYTSGRAWNHDVPVMLTLMMTWILFKPVQSQRWATKQFILGFLLGVAAGVRASFALIAIPLIFAVVDFYRPEGKNSFRKIIFSVLAGAFAGLLPLILLGALEPAGTYFGNIEYAKMNTVYRAAVGHDQALSLYGKLEYFWGLLQEDLGTKILFGLLLIAIIQLVWKKFVERNGELSKNIYLLGVTASLLAGALAPTPSWYQYYFAPLPFIILAIAYSLSQFQKPNSIVRYLAIASLMLSTYLHIKLVNYKPIIASLQDPSTGVPMEAHRVGIAIDELIDDGKILTLGPIFPLEGGLMVYPPLTTGPFSWRTGDFLTAKDRERFQIISPQNLETAMENDPPTGVLVGLEQGNIGLASDPYSQIGGLEVPLEEYARNQAYKPFEIATDIVEGQLVLWRK